MGRIVLVTLLIILVIFLFVALFLRQKRVTQDLELRYVKVFQFNSNFTNLDKTDEPTSPFSDIIQMNNYQISKEFSNANLILFSDFSFIDQNISNVQFKRNVPYFIYGLKGSDEMANKASLAKYFRENGHYAYIPQSFVLDNNLDLEQLISEHKSDSLYMIKKNIQRQEGNMITNDIDFIVNKAVQENYVVCQELLQNPYLVNGRKINMRVYLLIVIKDKQPNFYIYNDGFMYYTPKFFEKGSIERDVNITTGYIDRKVYEENPLTHKDFDEFLGESQSQLLRTNMKTMFKALKHAYSNVLARENKKLPGIKFNVYGVDIAPDEKLNITLIEVNKGPSIEKHDARDGELKFNMIQDCFTLVGLSKLGNPRNYIEI